LLALGVLSLLAVRRRLAVGWPFFGRGLLVGYGTFQVGDVEVRGAAQEGLRVLQVVGGRQQVRVRPQRVTPLGPA
jgi:hypothetical protein